MATEPNKPVLLRTVKRVSVADLKDAPKNGIQFEGVEKTNCPHCKAVVPLANAKPLTSVPCPACGGKVLVPGRVGGFLLYEHIGEGEMGTIYRATDESLKRDVAVKLVRGCHADDPESCERLRSEACAAGRLNHPRVAQVYALNFSNGHPYLVMELVTGQDFAHKMEREGRIEERVALRMALDVADGLSALNREGLVHGDIKPGNIVLDRDGNAKLVDFGLSGMTRRDSTGALVGTPNYIAPELLRGAADTHRSDIYSLGATLYHLLAGRPPLDGEKTIDIIKARMLRRPISVGTLERYVSSPTRKLVMRMLEQDPARRLPDSDAVAEGIRDALAKLDLPPPPVTPAAVLFLRRVFSQLRSFMRSRPTVSNSRRRPYVTLFLGLVAAIELLIAFREQAFDQTWEWVCRSGSAVFSANRRESFGQTWEGIRGGVAARIRSMTSSASEPEPEPELAALGWQDVGQTETAALLISRPQNQPEPVIPARDGFTMEIKPVWQSVCLGASTPSGSTMQMGGTLIIQGMGTDMWKGHDRCRFVWTSVSGDYAFSAQVMVIADNDPFAVTGLLVKGSEPALGSGLLYGFLGSGELFLQIRDPNNKTVVVRRSGQPLRLPQHLKLIRRGQVFEASFSGDGRAWTPFGACELTLPSGNMIGFVVSPQVPDTLATAKLASIHLLTPGSPVVAPPHHVPDVIKSPGRATTKQ